MVENSLAQEQEGGSVAANHFDVWMGSKPGCDGPNRPVSVNREKLSSVR